MTLPGNNELRICDATLMKIVEERLNADVQTGAMRIRVTSFRHNFDGFFFGVTTDPKPISVPQADQTAKAA